MVDVSKTIPILTEQQRTTLKEKISLIAMAVQPEKIICFSARNKVVSMWGCFVDQDAFPSMQCHLLVIRKNEASQGDYPIADKIESLSCESLTIYAIVHTLAYVNRVLENGVVLFTEIYRHGVLLFENNSDVQLSPPGDDILVDTEANDAIWKSWNEQGVKWLCSAAVSIRSQAPPHYALTEIRIAAARICYGLVQVVTGYQSPTHSAPRLLRLMKYIFPGNTEEEKKILSMLYNGDYDPDYRRDFIVTSKTVSCLFDRVCELQRVAESIYNERRKFLRNDLIKKAEEEVAKS